MNNAQSNDQGRLHGQAARVTGAASGIGRATAILFANEGENVALGVASVSGATLAVDGGASA